MLILHIFERPSDERVAVLIRGGPDLKTPQLVGIPIITNLTGAAQHSAVVNLLEKWDALNNLMICFLKMQLLSRKWTTSDEEALKVERMSKFIVLCHSEAFLLSRISTTAPFVDITCVSYMTEYQTLDEEIEKEVIKSTMNHLWYLTEKIVAFSIFYESLSPTLRRAMVDKLLSTPRPITFNSCKKKFPPISLTNQKNCAYVSLSLIGKISWLIFLFWCWMDPNWIGCRPRSISGRKWLDFKQ